MALHGLAEEEVARATDEGAGAGRLSELCRRDRITAIGLAQRYSTQQPIDIYLHPYAAVTLQSYVTAAGATIRVKAYNARPIPVEFPGSDNLQLQVIG